MFRSARRSSIKLRVSHVEASADCSLIRLWGSAGERTEDYRKLRRQLQAEAPALPSAAERARPPAPGEPCLLDLNGVWHRCRLLQPGPASELRVFLQDLGYACSASLANLKLAPASLFLLPPRVQRYILSNLLPREKATWSEQALGFLASLQGQEVEGLVRDLILPQGLILLEVPSIIERLLQLDLARLLPDSSFRAVLEKRLTLATGNLSHPEGSTMFPISGVPGGPPPHSECSMDYFYPRIQVGLTAAVLVTEVANPQLIYCQLRSLSSEVLRLSDGMTRYYELQGGRVDPKTQQSFGLGQPCASRSTDGRWHRSLLQEYLPDKHLAAVVQVDWGRKDVIPVSSLRALAPDFFRMPVVTFPCSLYGVSHEFVGWDRAHLFELRSLLCGRPLSAKIEFYNSYSHLYAVSFFGDDGRNINSLYSCRARTVTICKASTPPLESPAQQDVAEALPQPFLVSALPTVKLEAGTFYDAMVVFVCDPSDFWITVADNAAEYSQAVEDMTSLYSTASKLDGIVAKPQIGQLCCTKFEDNQYYRAEVVAIHEKRVDVFYIDHGNTGTVNWYDVKELPARFQDLPGSAVRCCIADVSPVEATWSTEAILAFKVAVGHRILVVHVVAKDNGKYIVEVLDQSKTKEKSIGKILSSAGQAKSEEYQTADRLPKSLTAVAVAKVEEQPAGEPISPESPANAHKELMPTPSRGDVAPKDVQQSPFGTLSFEPGTTVEVVVSFADNPSLFWCRDRSQVAKLDDLMDKVQEHCLNAGQPFDGSTPGCLARNPIDGHWYRALVTKMPKRLSASGNVEILYVDYGMKESVPSKNLRAIDGKLLRLKAQAVRCSLYNQIVPDGGDVSSWDKTATTIFKDFVHDPEKSHPFYCMVYAVASVQNERFNIVDISTPFSSVCDLLVDRGLATRLSNKAVEPHVQLHSYFYSTHDIKIGNEVEIYVTYVVSSSEFYCQLARSTKTMENISSLIKQMTSETEASESSQHLGPLCLAKYTDQLWYRGFISSAGNNPNVFFVDYGNTDKVEDEDLLPINPSACELLHIPMQALKCSLSDIPQEIPDEIDSWFEKAVMDKPMKALIVARDTDGKLFVELYDGDQQVNASLRKKFGLRSQRTTGRVTLSDVGKDYAGQNTCVEPVWADPTPEPVWAEPTPEPQACSLGSQESVPAQVNFGRVAPQWPKGTNDNALAVKPNKSRSPQMKPSGGRSRRSASPSVKLSDLPTRVISPGSCFLTNVSGVNTIDDFYVQIDEKPVADEIHEALNTGRKIPPEPLAEEDVQEGDLVCAHFEANGLNYRAVIKEKRSDGFQVLCVDYGTTSVIPADHISSLPDDVLWTPAMSFNCTLNPRDFAVSGLAAEDLALLLLKRTKDLLITCTFIQQRDEKWEVELRDGSCSVNDLLKTALEDSLPNAYHKEDDTPATIPKVNDPARSFTWNLPQPGDAVQAYASYIESPTYFWCQLSTLDIADLELQVQEAGEQTATEDNYVSTLFPGAPCNALSSKDYQWYRAFATNMYDGTITIRYVDYGNEEVIGVDKVSPLPDTLMEVPAQAFPCCLAGFTARCWSSEAKTYFFDRISEQCFDLEIVDTVSYGMYDMSMLSVNIRYKGDSVNKEMLRFCGVSQQTDTSTNPPPPAEDVCMDVVSLELESADSDVLGSAQESGGLEEPGELKLQRHDDGDDLEGFVVLSTEELSTDGTSLPPSWLPEAARYKSTHVDNAKRGYSRVTSWQDELLTEGGAASQSLDVPDSNSKVSGFISDGARVAKYTLSFLESSVNPQEPYFQDSLLEPNTSHADICETDVQELSFSTIQDHGYQSEYTMDEGDQYLLEEAHKIEKDPQASYTQDLPDSPRGAATAEDPKSLSACEILDPSIGVLESLDIEGLPVRTWDPAAADDTDPAHMSDGDDNAGFDGDNNVNQKDACAENIMTLDGTEEAYEIVCKLELCGLQTTENEENLVPTEGTDGTFAEDVCEPDAGNLVYDRDLPENTESPALVYIADTVTTSDLCQADDGDLETVNPEDLAYAEPPALDDALENVERSAVDEAETDLVDDQDWHPESSAPADVYVGDYCMSEADVLEGADNQDTDVCADSPVPVNNLETVYGSDVCNPEAYGLGENNEDLPISIQHAGSLDTLDNVDRSDANEIETGGGVGDLDLDLHTESPAPPDDTSNVYVEEDVHDPEAEDLDVHTEILVPAETVDDVHVDAGVCEPEANILEGSDNKDLPVFAEGSSSVADMYNVEKSDAYQAEAGDLVVDLDRHMHAESQAPVDVEDRIYVVDVCEPEADSLAESDDGLLVFTENAASIDAVERCDAGDLEDDIDLNVYPAIPAPAEFSDVNVEDDCNTEAEDLDGEQDLPDNPVLVDDTENVDTCDVCECEDPVPVDTDNLQRTACVSDCKVEQDLPGSPVPVDDTENVDSCDVCESEEPVPVDTDNLQRTACASDCKVEQDLPLCMENDGSEVGAGPLYMSDVHEAGAPESIDYDREYDQSLGLPVHSVTPAAVGDTGRRYTGAVCHPEAVDLESGVSRGTSCSEKATSQDLPEYTDGSVPAADATCTSDAGDCSAGEGKPVDGQESDSIRQENQGSSSSNHSPVAETIQ